MVTSRRSTRRRAAPRSSRCSTPAPIRSGARRFDETRLLLERWADATRALVTAMWNTKEEFARFGEFCLAQGADLAAARSADRPLLNDLVRWGKFAPALWLLGHGAAPNQPDAQGFTPQTFAIAKKLIRAARAGPPGTDAAAAKQRPIRGRSGR